jgi:glycosyltransferase involved in cell wall biosynthesis
MSMEFGDDRTDLRHMGPSVDATVVIPAYNEAAVITAQLDALRDQVDEAGRPLPKQSYEILISDNNSTDDTILVVQNYARRNPDLQLGICRERRKGVALALKRGMDLACERSRGRDMRFRGYAPFFLLAAHADSIVDRRWISALIGCMKRSGAALGVCEYFYNKKHFEHRPRLWEIIALIMAARTFLNSLFGGFPEGKGYAVRREDYERVGGIDVFYQVSGGDFVPHPSDDWDFAIKVRASGGTVIFCQESTVEVDPRRVDEHPGEMAAGRVYGDRGVFRMSDVRVGGQISGPRDVEPGEAQSLWDFAVKDVVHKSILLPIFLDPSCLERQQIRDFLSSELCDDLRSRISGIKEDTRLVDFTRIHTYKTPCYRLYFEFVDRVCDRMARWIAPRFSAPPSLPPLLDAVRSLENPEEWRRFIYYYCEDRESGEAHRYFGTGVF